MPTSRDGVELDRRSLAALEDLARAYRAGDKALQKRVRTALQDAAKPLAAEVIRRGAESLPARGGLRERVARARGGVTASLGGRNVSVSIRASNREKDSLRSLDATGQLRHPVFGNRSVWAAQRVPAHTFTDAFNHGAPDVRDKVSRAIQQALDDIAREV